MPKETKTEIFLDGSDSTKKLLNELNIIVKAESSLLELIRHIEEKEADNVMEYYHLHRRTLDLSQADHRGNLPIHYAAVHGLYGCDVLKTLSDQCKLINSINNYAMTPLHLAASAGNTQTVVELLNLGADVFEKDADNRQAYYYAFKKDHQDIVAIIRERINAIAKHREIIQAAKEFDDKELENLLRERVVFTSRIRDSSGSTALHYLARGNNLALLNHVSKNQDRDFLNAQNREGDTALHIAGRYGQTEVFIDLLKSSIDLFIKNIKQHTALDLAVIYGHFSIVQLYSNRIKISPDIIHSMLIEAVSAFYPLRSNWKLNKFNDSTERNVGIFKNLELLFSKNIQWITKDKERNNYLHIAICKADCFADAKPILKELINNFNMAHCLGEENQNEETPEELAISIFPRESKHIIDFFSSSQNNSQKVFISQEKTEILFKESPGDHKLLKISPLARQHLTDMELMELEEHYKFGNEESCQLGFNK